MFVNKHLNGQTFDMAGNDIGVLLFHGLTATTAEVAPLAKYLAKAGYSIHAPCLPGHGTTVKDLNNTKWQAWINAAELAFQTLSHRCEYVFVGGESVGAILALYLAAKHPKIKGVLAYAPAMAFNLTIWQWLLIYLCSPFISSIKKPYKHYHKDWQGYDAKPLKSAIQVRHLQKHVKGMVKHIQQPVFLAYANKDTLISVPAIKSLISALPLSPILLPLKSDEHAIIIGENRKMIFAETLSFLVKHID